VCVCVCVFPTVLSCGHPHQQDLLFVVVVIEVSYYNVKR